MHGHQAKYTVLGAINMETVAPLLPTVILFSSFCSRAHYDVRAICVVAACQQIDASLGESR